MQIIHLGSSKNWSVQMKLEKHHKESLDKFLRIYENDETVLGILLCGSIAHGYSKADSDIDICLVVSDEEFVKRKKEDALTFGIFDICTYENGYIDCKVADLEFLEKTARYGSDPARYAFKDCEILLSRIDNLNEVISRIAVYPTHKIDERRNRFVSQLLAWKWYYGEAVKKRNQYLINLSLHKLVLFSARIILNENKLLYPFHKWMLAELERAYRKPENLINKINDLLDSHSTEKINKYCEMILQFINFTEKSVDWPNYFLRDSEQNWLEHEAPVDDL